MCQLGCWAPAHSIMQQCRFWPYGCVWHAAVLLVLPSALAGQFPMQGSTMLCLAGPKMTRSSATTQNHVGLQSLTRTSTTKLHITSQPLSDHHKNHMEMLMAVHVLAVDMSCFDLHHSRPSCKYVLSRNSAVPPLPHACTDLPREG